MSGSFIGRIAKTRQPSYLNPSNKYLARVNMTIESWLQAAVADAELRALPDLKPLLEALARATTVLRDADWNGDATGGSEGRPWQR
jgi:hypothetical protein